MMDAFDDYLALNVRTFTCITGWHKIWDIGHVC